MSAIELNKFAGAILFALLMMFGARTVSNIIFHTTKSDKPGWDIAVEDPDTGSGGQADAPEMSLAQFLSLADVDKGKRGANKCAGCHTFDQGGATKTGPNLYGVVGRKAGSTAGYSYSSAISSKGSWSFAELDVFLKNPKDYAPGTKMSYAGISKPSQRADLILYLRSLSASPVPLPKAEPLEPPAAEPAAEQPGKAEAEPAATAASRDGGEVTRSTGAAPEAERAKPKAPAIDDPETTGSIEPNDAAAKAEKPGPIVRLPERNTKRLRAEVRR